MSSSPRAGTSLRRGGSVGLAVVAVLLALVGSACGTKENRQAEDDRRRTDEFCVKVPTRSFGEIFVVVSASGADADAANGLVEFAANGFSDPPTAIKGDVDVVIARFRATNGAAGTADEPEVAAAIDRVDAWLATNCPPPSTVPATSRPGGPASAPGVGGS